MPIVIGQLGTIILGFADTLMIGHHSTIELGAADLVKDAAARHILQRDLHHFHSIWFLHNICIPHEKQQIVGCREFRCSTKAAPFMVKLSRQLSVSLFHQLTAGFLPITSLAMLKEGV